MNKRRKFNPLFKSQVVLQLLSGERSMAELCPEHQLTSQMIGTWNQPFVATMTGRHKGKSPDSRNIAGSSSSTRSRMRYWFIHPV